MLQPAHLGLELAQGFVRLFADELRGRAPNRSNDSRHPQRLGWAHGTVAIGLREGPGGSESAVPASRPRLRQVTGASGQLRAPLPGVPIAREHAPVAAWLRWRPREGPSRGGGPHGRR